jgi:hypothetical protein
MTSPYTAQVDDLVLFFRDDQGTLGIRLVPHDVYTEPRLAVDLAKIAPGYAGSLLSELAAPKGGFFYVANLSRLLDPGEPAFRNPALAEHAHAVALAESNGAPGDGDLVVVPYDQPDSGYLVSRSVYQDCPVLTNVDIPDVTSMALNDGVILANIPKTPPNGITCYLLSLVSLRSGALDAVQHKTAGAQAMAHAAHEASAKSPGKS